MALSEHEVSTPFGPLRILQTDLGIASIGLDPKRASGQFEAWRRKHTPQERLVSRELDGEFAEQIDAYLGGNRLDLSFRLDVRGTEFQKRVWDALQAIPRGSVQTYGQIAKAIGSAKASQAVGRANGANPLPIVIPCHRVVAKSGMGGFSGPMAWKHDLLALEGVCLDLSSDG